jgi:hypothetical protein
VGGERGDGRVGKGILALESDNLYGRLSRKVGTYLPAVS